MDRERTRRGVLGALLAGGVAGAFVPDVRTILDRFAPFSGSLWDTARDRLPGTVESPYGAATLRYDDAGVPHVEADTERALYFAAGYAQGADRLFQMALQRRQLRGTLSAVVGEVTLPSDRFYTKMDFVGAAEATWAELAGTATGDVVEAYVEGVNRHLDRPLPAEFDLLGFEPDPWEPTDVALAEKQIAWQLTGGFRTLRKATVAAELGPEAAEQLLPDRLDHDAPVLGHDRDGAAASGVARRDLTAADGSADTTGTDATGRDGGTASRPATAAGDRAFHPDLDAWLSAFEPAGGVGSNSWLVAGEHTASGAPLLANDPHLSLLAPPVWYEMHLVGPETDVRGVAFPGEPFVVIGENDAGAWGFTNAGADVIDFYEYETRDGEYRYGDEWRAFETEERTVEVAGGEDRTVETRKTVHGPVLDVEADGDELRTEVGVAWTGLAASRTPQAVRGLCRSDGLTAAREALRRFDTPTQNCVYADRDGNTLYRVTGRVPIRRTDGDPVPADRIFDGSAREGEWPGYTPYGDADWDGEGFIPDGEMPHVEAPGYVGTANQRVVDDADYPHYFAEAYAQPYRGTRLWNRLDERVAADDPVDPAFMRDLQRDAHDLRAEQFVPVMLDARSAVPEGAAQDALDALEGWDYRLQRDSRAALVFARFVHHYRDVVFGARLEGLDDRRDAGEYYGHDWALLALPPESAWFPEGRPAAIAGALSRTADELDAEGWETYGDYNTTAFDHPFDQSWLNYPRHPTDGGETTLNNLWQERGIGSSWRMVCTLDGSSSVGILPGGNDGSPFSDHYADQLRRWADGEYKPLAFTVPETVEVTFEEGDG